MAREYKGTGNKAEKKGEGLGGGPVGSSGGYSGRPGGSQPSQQRPSSAQIAQWLPCDGDPQLPFLSPSQEGLASHHQVF